MDESRDDISIRTRNLHLRSRIEHQKAFAVRVRLHLPHQVEVDDRRAVHPLEAPRIEPLFEVLHRLAQDQSVIAGLDAHIVAYLSALSLDFILLAAWTALYYGINYFLLLEDQIRLRERLESQASSAQLAMLRYQLNPHFLFNTLNSISTLVLLKQTERANAMLARLSSFLRYTLANEPTAKVTLAQEVETLKLYLEIEKMRFEDRLRPHFKIEPETIGARLPSLLLQPLIENAIKYAVTPAENGADIWITATREGLAVRVEVADNGDGNGGELAASPSTGVGLANIRDRLSQAYGAAHRFDTRQNERGGFSVIIEIPFETGETA
jgi:LytS/YehU family sensor histidine kinase